MRRLALLPLLVMLLTVAIAATTRAAPAVAPPPPNWFQLLYETAGDWPDNVWVVGLAFGDVDGDGRDEIAIARNAQSGARLLVLDDAAAGFAPLWSFGEAWGPGAYATSVALGNIDDDPAAEIGVTRATSVNERVFVFDDVTADFALLEGWGADWGPAVHAIDIALGPAGVAFANNATTGPRVFVHGGPAVDFALLRDIGDGWGAAAVATAVAFGDTNGDGMDEIGVTRQHDSNERAYLFDLTPDTEPLWQTGATWGVGAWAVDIAFGNVDDDPADEIGVARRSAVNERALLFDDATADDPFAVLAGFGQSWNPNAFATTIAFGDVDGDSRDEIAIAREVTINPRVFVYDDAVGAPDTGRPPYGQVWGFGEGWPGPVYATAVAFGHTDAAPEAELAVGRRAPEEKGPLVFIFERAWASYVPFAPLPEEDGTTDFADSTD